MIQVHSRNPKALVSPYGKKLLQELNDPATARLEVVLEYVRKDPLAGRLKRQKSGDNAFHLILGSPFPKQFTLQALECLIEHCPDGLKVKNESGNYPLHLCLSQFNLIPEAVLMIAEKFPEAAGLVNDQGLIPLFLCVMRNDSTASLCRALCKAFPAGPSTENKTHSYPLHFAVRRVASAAHNFSTSESIAYRTLKNSSNVAHRSEHIEIIRILLRRYPEAARKVNFYGLLPLHCLCAVSDDMEAARILLDAYPEAIAIPDRQGRTCLHIAVLAVGKDHSNAVAKEEEEMQLERQRLQSLARIKDTASSSAGGNGTDLGGEDGVYFDHDAEDGDNDSEFFSDSTATAGKARKGQEVKRILLERSGSRSRQLIRMLVETWPGALVAKNNFQAIPVDTVLEKKNPVRTKNRIVSVYGLYDDPPTARLLLCMQRRYHRETKVAVQRQMQLAAVEAKEREWEKEREKVRDGGSSSVAAPVAGSPGSVTLSDESVGSSVPSSRTPSSILSVLPPSGALITSTSVANHQEHEQQQQQHQHVIVFPAEAMSAVPYNLPTHLINNHPTAPAHSDGTDPRNIQQLSMQIVANYDVKDMSKGPVSLLPDIRPRYEPVSRDLNWLARRDALFVSLAGEPSPHSPYGVLLRGLSSLPSLSLVPSFSGSILKQGEVDAAAAAGDSGKKRLNFSGFLKLLGKLHLSDSVVRAALISAVSETAQRISSIDNGIVTGAAGGDISSDGAKLGGKKTGKKTAAGTTTSSTSNSGGVRGGGGSGGTATDFSDPDFIRTRVFASLSAACCTHPSDLFALLEVCRAADPNTINNNNSRVKGEYNILAKLRRAGLVDAVRLAISWL